MREECQRAQKLCQNGSGEGFSKKTPHSPHSPFIFSRGRVTFTPTFTHIHHIPPPPRGNRTRNLEAKAKNAYPKHHAILRRFMRMPRRISSTTGLASACSNGQALANLSKLTFELTRRSRKLAFELTRRICLLTKFSDSLNLEISQKTQNA